MREHEGPAAIQHLDLSVVLVVPDGSILPAVVLVVVDPPPVAPRRGRVVELLFGGGRGELGGRPGVCFDRGRLVFVLPRIVLAALGSVGFPPLRIRESGRF